MEQRSAKKYVNRTTKFGIEFPNTVYESMELENNNGNTLWSDAITK